MPAWDEVFVDERFDRNRWRTRERVRLRQHDAEARRRDPELFQPWPDGRTADQSEVQLFYEHVDELGGRAERIAVAGDSAGGNLAASIALHCRVTGRSLDARLLIHPAVDRAAGLAAAGAETGSIDSAGDDSSSDGFFTGQDEGGRTAEPGKRSQPSLRALLADD